MAVQNNPVKAADNNPFKAVPATTFGAGAIQNLITGGTGKNPAKPLNGGNDKGWVG